MVSVVDGARLEMRISPVRRAKVQAGVEGLLSRRNVAVCCVEVVLGHLTFCALANQALLTIPHTLYNFARTNYWAAARLWDSCRQELRAMAALLFLARADWTLQWNDVVYESDASVAGYGVKVARWPLAAVQGCGRQGEHQRFKRIGPQSAREAALGAAGLGLRDGLWACRPASTAADEAEVRDWAVDRQFPGVDAAGLKESLWSTVRQGFFRHAEDILVLEARAAVKGMERLACGAYGSRMRQLFFLDNMSLVLCLCRGRSRSFSVVLQLRRARHRPDFPLDTFGIE